MCDHIRSIHVHKADAYREFSSDIDIRMGSSTKK